MEINRQRLDRCFFDRGGVYPRGWPEGPSQRRAECLIEGLDPSVEVTVRFLHLVERQVLDATGEPVSELVVTGRCHCSGEETMEREVRIPSLPNRTAALKAAGSERAELVENGAPAGALLWWWEPLHATVEAWIDEIESGLRRVRVDVANRLEWDEGTRAQALARTLYATHVVMHSPDGAFASIADPPAHLREESACCHNDSLWPVPVGEAGDRRTILAAPILLEDYPQIDSEGSSNPSQGIDPEAIAARRAAS